jgi:hypothetical protein
VSRMCYNVASKDELHSTENINCLEDVISCHAVYCTTHCHVSWCGVSFHVWMLSAIIAHVLIPSCYEFTPLYCPCRWYEFGDCTMHGCMLYLGRALP